MGRHHIDETRRAIRNGQFGEWPRDLQKEALLRSERDNWTALHELAYFGLLGKIPRECLTEKALLTPAKNGDTPLHFASRQGRLHTVPIKLSIPTLKALLQWERRDTCQESQTWIKKEIQKQELLKSLENCHHSDL